MTFKPTSKTLKIVVTSKFKEFLRLKEREKLKDLEQIFQTTNYYGMDQELPITLVFSRKD